MIHFVVALPPVLEPNSIYYVDGGEGNALHFVSDQGGNPIEVSTENLVQAYMATLKGSANGYAELDGSGKVPSGQLPAGSTPGDISAVETGLQNQINLKADASAVYTQAAVDGIETGLQGQINGKQATLSNASDVAKIGNGTFEGKPLILLETTDW